MTSVHWDFETMDPRGDPYLELRGQTPDGELILASSGPPRDGDYERWFEDFESGMLATIPVDLQAYFGPDDDPPIVEHIIFIGHGLVSWQGSDLIFTLAPDVFRDAAASLLMGHGSDYADIELRIFHIFTLIDPEGFSRFLSTLETLQVPQSLDSSRLIIRNRKPTYEKPLLNVREMITVLGRKDGIISYQQLYRHIPLQDRTLREYLRSAEMVDVGQKRLTRCLFTSDEILNTFLPWLRDNLATEDARTFVQNLIIGKLIPR